MEYLLNIFKIRMPSSRKTSEDSEIIQRLDNLETMVFVASRQQTVQRDELVYLYFKKFEQYKFSLAIIPLEGRNRSMYMPERALKDIYSELLNSIATKEKFAAHLDEYNNLIEEYHRAEVVFMNTTADKKDVLKSFLLYLHLTEKTGNFAWMPYAIENVVDLELKEYLKVSFPEKAQEYFEIISSPTKLHAYQLMRLDICHSVIEGKDMPDAVKDLVEKYQWYGEYSYVENLYGDKYFIEEMAGLSIENAKEEKRRLTDEVSNNLKKYELVIKKITNPRMRLCAEIVNSYVFLRTDRTDTRKRIQMHFRKVLDRVAECLYRDISEKWNREEVACLLNSEIEMYLCGKKIPNKGMVAQRLKDYIYLRDKSGVVIHSDSETIKYAVRTITKATDKSENIKGFSAFKGVAVGPVAFVSSKTDLHKVVKGSVLVARTTMVDYIQAMERSVAIVTDEGGITSHAAIVARELKKPCIVGTKIATKILKDGDMVEVNALTGLVKKI